MGVETTSQPPISVNDLTILARAHVAALDNAIKDWVKRLNTFIDLRNQAAGVLGVPALETWRLVIREVEGAVDQVVAVSRPQPAAAPRFGASVPSSLKSIGVSEVSTDDAPTDDDSEPRHRRSVGRPPKRTEGRRLRLAEKMRATGPMSFTDAMNLLDLPTSSVCHLLKCPLFYKTADGRYYTTEEKKEEVKQP